MQIHAPRRQFILQMIKSSTEVHIGSVFSSSISGVEYGSHSGSSFLMTVKARTILRSPAVATVQYMKLYFFKLSFRRRTSPP
jgi:hypothetical protein